MFQQIRIQIVNDTIARPQYAIPAMSIAYKFSISTIIEINRQSIAKISTVAKFVIAISIS